MHRRNLIFIVLLFLLFSCKKEKQEGCSNVQEIEFSTLEYKIFPVPTEKMQFVKLETTESNLVGDIEKIEVRDGLFFVLDKNRNLFVFDFKGKFLNRIGVIGQGPSELRHLSHFYVDEKRRLVGIYDLFQKQIYRYSYNGELQDKIDVADCLSGRIVKIYGLSDGHILVSMGKRKENSDPEYNFQLNSFINGCVKIDSYCPYRFKSDRNEYVSWSQIGINSKDVFCSPVFSDSIYSLNDNGEIKSKYVFKNEAKSVDTFEGIGMTTNIIDVTVALKKGGYSQGIRSLYVTDKNILFSFFNLQKRQFYYIVWDMEENKGYYTDHPILPYTINSGIPIYTSYKKQFVTAFQASQILELQEMPYAVKGNQQLDAIMSELTEEDNPIIVLYELE